jgi:hypothetical protein
LEIRLTFKELELREIYEDFYNELRAELKLKLQSRKRTLITLIVWTCLIFTLTFLRLEWIYYGLTSLLLTFLFMIRSIIIKQKVDKWIRKHKSEIDQFISKLYCIGDVRYSYNDTEIKYYESTELKDTLRWTNVDYWINNEKCLRLYFKNPQTNIMIPKKMVQQEELELFIDKINEQVKEASFIAKASIEKLLLPVKQK